MNNQYAGLLNQLPIKHQSTLIALLSYVDSESWYNAKHLIVCSNPLLTLEMAINRISNRERNEIPDCNDIAQALAYAEKKRIQSLELGSNFTTLSSDTAA